VKARLSILRHFRGLAAAHASRLADSSAALRQRPLEEVLTAEVIPLLDAVKFLERQAPSILAPRRLGAQGRPFWLTGVQASIQREPLGVILVISPSNYPLFLPAVQVVHALAAGNAVAVKPGAGGSAVMRCVVDLLHHAGLDHRLVEILPEDIPAARAAISAGVDKVVLTGSVATGSAVLEQLAGTLTPAVMELSGCDPVFVSRDADLDRVVRALRFGALLNDGATCIAPRRVFAHRSIATELEGRIAMEFRQDEGTRRPLPLKPEWVAALREALGQGAHLVSGALVGDTHCFAPLVLAGALPEMRLLQDDIFAPVLSLITVTDDHEAIELARHCPYALGATVFSRDIAKARELADQIEAGVVVINDMIVPTADPRIPFAGRHRSGFGSTRGEEGLLEMTTPKVVSVRHSSWLPHLEPRQEGDVALFENYVLAGNALGWSQRVLGTWRLAKGILRRAINRKLDRRTAALTSVDPLT
jgi:acyl-CoA reductase-like NAD-dependent aldehyde dehydrogenase